MLHLRKTRGEADSRRKKGGKKRVKKLPARRGEETCEVHSLADLIDGLGHCSQHPGLFFM
jgi:hypothetical protein